MSERRRGVCAALLVAICVIAPSCGGGSDSTSSSTQTPSTDPVPVFSNVFLVVLENQRYDTIVGGSAMPFLKSLIATNALATNYYGNSRHSLANHTMLTAGTLVDDDATVVNADNLVRRLLANGKTWKAYSENLPSVGYTANDAYPYERRHNPFAYYPDVLNDPAQRDRLVPLTQFFNDLNADTLPSFSYLQPNERHNAHDCPVPNVSCTNNDKLAAADQWLQATLTPLLISNRFKSGGLLVIVFDSAGETDRANGGGHVAAVLVSARAKPGVAVSTFFQHQNVLRLTCEALTLSGCPGATADANNMGALFTR